MILDGKRIAEEIVRDLRTTAGERVYSLAIISVAPNFATQKYLAIKERVAADAGVKLYVLTLGEDVTTEEVRAAIATHREADGVVLQLPYPPHIDVAALLAELPRRVDVDVIGDEARVAFENGDETVLPPVVGAIAHIAAREDISFSGKQVTVIGKGKLVGAPAALWAAQHGGIVTALSKDDAIEASLAIADIVILGAGVPGLVQPSMLKEGVVLLDAGTSEDAGRLVGDADPRCHERAALMTPVPGGIGPLAVALLFKNLHILANVRKTLSMD
jgi:5,10-methylene-tetrahydrofolate dehydrogenase/methenyl tetrahydrofolate cyclohydrolase